jgi:hypothetical protein
MCSDHARVAQTSFSNETDDLDFPLWLIKRIRPDLPGQL